jgi:hypothetical protein
MLHGERLLDWPNLRHRQMTPRSVNIAVANVNIKVANVMRGLRWQIGVRFSFCLTSPKNKIERESRQP